MEFDPSITAVLYLKSFPPFQRAVCRSGHIRSVKTTLQYWMKQINRSLRFCSDFFKCHQKTKPCHWILLRYVKIKHKCFRTLIIDREYLDD